MYDALKRKCITPSTFEGGDAVSNDRTRNALANYTIPIGSDQGNSISYQMKERVSKLTYPTLQHCLRMLYTMNGNSKHKGPAIGKKGDINCSSKGSNQYFL